MAQQLIGHRCTICGMAYTTRKAAKEHVTAAHAARVSLKQGPGQHVSGIWHDLNKPY